jgi:hypothetical protein
VRWVGRGGGLWLWLGRRVRGWFGLGGPLVPNGQSTVALRGLCRARKDLVAHRVRVANQLREHLNRVFPGAVGLFTKLDSPISLRFLARFDCQDRADLLTPRRLESWLKSMGYCGRTDPALDLRAPPTLLVSNLLTPAQRTIGSAHNRRSGANAGQKTETGSALPMRTPALCLNHGPRGIREVMVPRWLKSSLTALLQDRACR